VNTPPKARPKRGRRVLRSAADTIDYEFAMLAHAYSEIGQGSPGHHNMALETFLLHARNLRDFFRAKGHPDDILARDFLGEASSATLPFVGSKTFDDRVNKKLSHPSFSRPRLRAKWQPSLIAGEIGRATERFLEELDAIHTRRSSWFADARKLVVAGKAAGII
jgi:hypothetical protein